jgi:predicted nuclease with TOPRIM domain
MTSKNNSSIPGMNFIPEETDSYIERVKNFQEELATQYIEDDTEVKELRLRVETLETDMRDVMSRLDSLTAENKKLYEIISRLNQTLETKLKSSA